MRRLARPAGLIAIALVAAVAIAARGRLVRPNPPTFDKEIVRILQTNCQTCHHPGDIAPFSLMTYESAKPWADAIKYMVSTRRMPPWKPSVSCEPLVGERKLTQEQIDQIGAWVDAGAPEGNAADLPPARTFDGGWSAGVPDLVLTMPETYHINPGNDIYRCFVLPSKRDADAAVTAIDTRPGNRGMVHHGIVYLDSTGISETLDAQDPGPGYTCFGGPGFTPDGSLGGWAPGARPAFLPDGVATSLPANARVVLQLHYHPRGGSGGDDQTTLGIYYTHKPVSKWLRYLPLINETFTIPPDAKAYPVDAAAQVPFFVSAQVWSVTPHMHLLGRTMRVEATYPDNSKKCLVDIGDWDFNWQGTYVYRDPIALPGGTFLSLHATFDNSTSNPRNPNTPPKAVSWGEQTTDEMCIAFLGVTVDGLAYQQQPLDWKVEAR